MVFYPTSPDLSPEFIQSTDLFKNIKESYEYSNKALDFAGLQTRVKGNVSLYLCDAINAAANCINDFEQYQVTNQYFLDNQAAITIKNYTLSQEDSVYVTAVLQGNDRIYEARLQQINNAVNAAKDRYSYFVENWQSLIAFYGTLPKALTAILIPYVRTQSAPNAEKITRMTYRLTNQIYDELNWSGCKV